MAVRLEMWNSLGEGVEVGGFWGKTGRPRMQNRSMTKQFLRSMDAVVESEHTEWPYEVLRESVRSEDISSPF